MMQAPFINKVVVQGHGILEMPTGTGKTVCLLALILSYIKAKKPNFKLIYCTRTIVEMEKTLEELKFVLKARKKDFQEPESSLMDEEDLSSLNSPILALCLSSRKNLCIHPVVSKQDDRQKVDSMCRSLTAPWAREKQQQSNNNKEESKKEAKMMVDIEDLGDVCSFYEKFWNGIEGMQMPKEVYTLDDLKDYGKKQGICPYFLARHFLLQANIIVYNYSYMLDPKISNMVSKELQKDCIVVFDECHNIDNACIEAFSLNINRKTLEMAGKNLTKLEEEVKLEEQKGTSKLQAEYQRLIKGLNLQNSTFSESELLAHPLLQQDVIQEAIPGSIRKAKHFLNFLRRIIVFLKEELKSREVKIQTPLQFVYNLQKDYFIDQKSLKFAHDRLSSLMNTLEISNIDEYSSINIVADLATLISTYFKGFTLIIEPYPEDNLIYDPLLQFYCLDASIATKPIFEKFRNVILTSGTISPIDIYPKILNFQPKVLKAFNIVLPRNAISPLIVTKGVDQLPISSKFDERENVGNLRNYGNLIVELSSTVPDGIVCFFTSYKYMEHIIIKWDEMGILHKVRENKLIYIETKDNLETIMALENYKQACDNGRGAVFFSIARGKVSEGVDFAGHYGRCVIMFGIPYQNTLSRNLKARMQYLKENFQIRENDFLTFDAMRQCSQCVGRVLRSKYDYGLMIFADKRYSRSDKEDKFPIWIRNQLEVKNKNLSVDIAIQLANQFFKEMGQPFVMPEKDLYGVQKLNELNNQNK